LADQALRSLFRSELALSAFLRESDTGARCEPGDVSFALRTERRGELLQ
jgi:hypothetical protein